MSGNFGGGNNPDVENDLYKTIYMYVTYRIWPILKEIISKCVIYKMTKTVKVSSCV